ncbi:MAG TPA: hypothetical protein VEA37_15135, partial [Flavobacterium sp.]|nr:hypothetical protein [Flavobacterium sp.]
MVAIKSQILLPFFCTAIVGLYSCDRLGLNLSQKEGQAVARVNDRYLYNSDLQSLIIDEVASNDSIQIVNAYINNWIRQNLILEKAKDVLSDSDLKETDEKVEDYRQSLITFIYERKLIAEGMDTVVNDQELRDYYNEFTGNFLLQNDIVL